MQSIWINDPGRQGKDGGATAGNAGEKRWEGRLRERLFGVSYFSNSVGRFPKTYHSEFMDEDPALFSYSAWGGEGIGLSLPRVSQAAAVFIRTYYYIALRMPLRTPFDLLGQNSARQKEITVVLP
jgi:hypothetical protein